MADDANRERSLLRFANDCEDAAAGLYKFRDALPRNATRITAVVGEFFAISSALRQIHAGEGVRSYGPSFYRIDNDLQLVFRSLQLTVEDIFEMFTRALERAEQVVWEDMSHKHERVEGYGLLERLEWYREFLEEQFDVLKGREIMSPAVLRDSITDLLAAQQRAGRRTSRQSMPVPDIDISGASTPRQRPRRMSRPHMPPRINTPSTPTVVSDISWDLGWGQFGRPFAPEPPAPPLMFPPTPASPMFPISPVFSNFTSSPPQPASSHTVYSNDPYAPSGLMHWAEEIFDGQYPTTQYRTAYQLSDRSTCYGQADPYALQHLSRDSFQKVLELQFDERKLWIQFYWRPNDFRARLLIISQASNSGRQEHFCQPLTALKVIRRGSTLQLCQASKNSSHYKLWARLNFLSHERMVLFYSTFIAMKHQDTRGIPHASLADDFELQGEEGEISLFAGEMHDGEMLHALRVFRDRGSGVLRLEATALRGQRKSVPIWTAFVTRYVHDPDWCAWEGGGEVSLAAIRPRAPCVFISNYGPPRDRLGRGWVLPFTTDEDAKMFVETWAGICRRYGG